MMKVKLQIFKRNGKWYTDGEYDTNKEHLFEIWEEIRDLMKHGKTPGLRESLNRNDLEELMVLVDIPAHPFNHPHIIC